jgi:hypothetical protein
MDDGVRSLVFCCVTLMGAYRRGGIPQKTLNGASGARVLHHHPYTPTSRWLSCLQFNTGETMTFNVAVVCLLFL